MTISSDGGSLYSKQAVAKMLGVTLARLRLLDRAGIVSPSGTLDTEPAYTFQDLVALRATRDLLAQRISMRDVGRAVGALRQSMAGVVKPLQELRIGSEGGRIVVRSGDGAFEPITGQLLIDFDAHQASERNVVRKLRRLPTDAHRRAAQTFYAQANDLDESAETFDLAEELYRKAIAADPTLAIAYTNLGNIRFRRGDEAGAEELYSRALAVDTAQPEAHYNLGYVYLERGEPGRAVPFFKRAVASDPNFSDAHFNLAMAYEQSGGQREARTHWKQYLQLEPKGTWADIARQHLA